MTELKPIASVRMSMVNKTNAAFTDYVLNLVPTTQISSLDILSIQFPSELTLPETLDCSTDSTYITSLNCVVKKNNMVQIKMTRVSKDFVSGEEIAFTFKNIKNAVSMKKSS
jgi:hypothetical protein